VSPWNSGGGAGLGYATGEHGVAKEAIGFIKFAGIHVRFASITCRIDEEGDFVSPQGSSQGNGIRVIKICAGDRFEGEALACEEGLISLANVTGTAE
jgi:hypothetical protein